MKTARSLVVLGAGGFAAEIIESADLSGWTVTCLYDDNPVALGRKILGRECVGTLADFTHLPRANYIFSIGSNEVRQKMATVFSSHGHEPCSIIHPDAVVSRSAVILSGAFVAALAFVGPQAQIGRHAIVNVAASVGHDSVLGDFSQVCPGARVSGCCVLGVGAFMGSNSVLGPRSEMEDWSQLGASSFAPRRVSARTLSIGVPARVVKF